MGSHDWDDYYYYARSPASASRASRATFAPPQGDYDEHGEAGDYAYYGADYAYDYETS